jgi:hypothetical protein
MGTTNNVFINIKDLPEVQQINNGDYLVVETQDGTSIIDFQNFILGEENNGLTAAVQRNADNIVSVSATTDTALQTLSSNIVSTFKRVYYGKAQIVISNGTEGIAILSPRPSLEVGEILPDDVIVVPANEDAVKYGGYAILVENDEENRGVVHVAGRFKRTSYSFSVNAVLDLENKDVNSFIPTESLSAYTPQDIFDYAKAILQLSPLTENPPQISVTEVDSTANELGVTAIYNVIVVKAY